LQGVRVNDEGLWGDIKKGDFTGFSVGGKSYKVPVAEVQED
jgi:hypothetical protein